MKFKLGSNQFKKIPIYHNEKVIERFHVGKQSIITKIDMFMVKWIKRMAVAAFMLGLLVGGLQIGRATTAPKIVSAQVIETVVATSTPVLDRIAKCESDNSQYDKNGQILLNYNKSSDSFDIGVMQINLKAWGAQAKKLGLNLSNETDNRAMGQWIYQNRGTGDWYSSERCWQQP